MLSCKQQVHVNGAIKTHDLPMCPGTCLYCAASMFCACVQSVHVCSVHVCFLCMCAFCTCVHYECIHCIGFHTPRFPVFYNLAFIIIMYAVLLTMPTHSHSYQAQSGQLCVCEGSGACQWSGRGPRVSAFL